MKNSHLVPSSRLVSFCSLEVAEFCPSQQGAGSALLPSAAGRVGQPGPGGTAPTGRRTRTRCVLHRLVDHADLAAQGGSGALVAVHGTRKRRLAVVAPSTPWRSRAAGDLPFRVQLDRVVGVHGHGVDLRPGRSAAPPLPPGARVGSGLKRLVVPPVGVGSDRCRTLPSSTRRRQRLCRRLPVENWLLQVRQVAQHGVFTRIAPALRGHQLRARKRRRSGRADEGVAAGF